jgi:hypothetical protein
MIVRIIRSLMLLLLMSMGAWASSINLTLDGNFSSPDYSWYSYTDTAGVQETQPVGPYITYLNGGPYDNTLVYTFCYDINSETDVGVSYAGQLETLTDTATMESTYLLNQLNLMGGFNAPLQDRGAVAMAIWEIMYPSSTTFGTAFESDPAAQPYELAAAAAVANGSWTVADSALYPTWVPNDPSVQRFGVIFSGVTEDSISSTTPEPASFVLVGLGVLGLAAFQFSATCRAVCRARRAGGHTSNPPPNPAELGPMV